MLSYLIVCKVFEIRNLEFIIVYLKLFCLWYLRIAQFIVNKNETKSKVTKKNNVTKKNIKTNIS